MSVTCEKSYNLEVVQASTAFAYYACEDSGGTTLADSVGNLDLTGDAVVSTAGKIANAILTGSAFTLKSWTNGPNPVWDFTGSSFTVRFWYKTALQGQSRVIVENDDQFEWNYDCDGVTMNNMFTVFFDTAPFFVDVFAGPVTDTDWHRFIGWYERGVGIGCKLDNNASVTAAHTGELDTASGTFFVGGIPAVFTPNPIDEIAVWKRKLTESEMLYDWNGGAGRTYPDIP